MLRLDEESGQLRLDDTIVAGSRRGYVDLSGSNWPHGASGPAWGHAALFLPAATRRTGHNGSTANHLRIVQERRLDQRPEPSIAQIAVWATAAHMPESVTADTNANSDAGRTPTTSMAPRMPLTVPCRRACRRGRRRR